MTSGAARRSRHESAVSLCILLALCILAFPPAAASSQVGSDPEYLDDRSSADEVVRSFFNAISRQEYARAYSYWEPGAAASKLPPFEEWAAGYEHTARVDVELGTIRSDVGAGQLYWLVPVSMTATMDDGSTGTFVGCYQLHLARPQLQAVPPFHPMSIQAAAARELGDDEDLTQARDTFCVRPLGS